VLKGRREPALPVMAEPENAVADHAIYPKVVSLYLR
jgi:hypothetical protein